MSRQIDFVPDEEESAEALDFIPDEEAPAEPEPLRIKAPPQRATAATMPREAVIRDLVMAARGDAGARERISGRSGATGGDAAQAAASAALQASPLGEGRAAGRALATHSPIEVRADAEMADAAMGSSEGTRGRYRGDMAGTVGLAQGLTFDHYDDIASGLSGRPIDEVRSELEQSEAQAPIASGIGRTGAALIHAAAIPGAGAGASLPARLAVPAVQGAGVAALTAHGLSEGETASERMADMPGAAVAGAGAGLAFSGAAEGIGAIGRAAVPAAQRAAAGVGDWARRGATRSRLEASGVWGGSAERAASQIRPGGPDALAADLRRMRVGERPGLLPTVPVAERAIEDVERIGSEGAQAMRALAGEADAAGVRIPIGATVQRVVQEAQQQAQQIGTRTALASAQHLAEELAPLASRADDTMTNAWRLRQHLDDQARWAQQAGNGSFIDLIRDARRALDSQMDDAMRAADPALLERWNAASRRGQIGAFMQQHGRGGNRLSQGGGMGGATAAGETVAAAVQGANPAGLAASVAQQGISRGIVQATRIRYPGAMARGFYEPAGDVATWLQSTLRSNPAALGEYATHFAHAMQRGAPLEAVAATHYLLSRRSPEYRAHIERARQEQTDGME